METLIPFATPIVTILGAGLSAFLGVRVALAEVRTKIEAHEDKLKEHNSRLNRLEEPYFKS